MLESDYLAQYTDLINHLPWDIELPQQWTNFFKEKGHMPSCVGDERKHQRFRLRTYGVMTFWKPLPAFPRPTDVIGVYTSDFSRQGCGLLTSFPLLPEEEVRLVLPTFWAVLSVVRVRRITRKCYEIGTELMSRNDPSEEAFEKVKVATPPSEATTRQ